MLKFSEQGAQPVEAKPSATIILVRDGSKGIEALLLQRNPELANMGGAWVFPGGKVDADDPGETPEERARHAAVRELQEEAGLHFPVEQLSYFSHWLTPVVVKARFATWFYLVTTDGDPEIRVDHSEIVASRWITAANALEENRGGELRLPPPTLVSLLDVANHASVAELVAAVRRREPPYFFPRIVKTGDDLTFLYPGDVGYEATAPDIPGVRHRSQLISGQFSYTREFDWPDKVDV